MEDILVSVIIPVYKVEEKYLRRCIESVLEQTYSQLEVILIDDGSPDKSGDICESYAEIDKRVRVIHKVNGGVSSARNQGLVAATGDYIFFIDSDDTLENRAIGTLLEVAKSTNADITVGSCKHTSEAEVRIGEDLEKPIRLRTVTSNQAVENLIYNIPVFEELEPTAVWGKLYNKATIKTLRFCEEISIGEDLVFNYFASCNANIVAYCDLKLYDYNFVATSAMNDKTYSPKWMQSFYELKKFVESQNYTQYYDALCVRCVNIAFTIYLKVPKDRCRECGQIELYIRMHRREVLKNPKAALKIKMALIMSYMGFDFVRWGFRWLKG